MFGDLLRDLLPGIRHLHRYGRPFGQNGYPEQSSLFVMLNGVINEIGYGPGQVDLVRGYHEGLLRDMDVGFHLLVLHVVVEECHALPGDFADIHGLEVGFEALAVQFHVIEQKSHEFREPSGLIPYGRKIFV